MKKLIMTLVVGIGLMNLCQAQTHVSDTVTHINQINEQGILNVVSSKITTVYTAIGTTNSDLSTINSNINTLNTSIGTVNTSVGGSNTALSNITNELITIRTLMTDIHNYDSVQRQYCCTIYEIDSIQSGASMFLFANQVIVGAAYRNFPVTPIRGDSLSFSSVCVLGAGVIDALYVYTYYKTGDISKVSPQSWAGTNYQVCRQVQNLYSTTIAVTIATIH